MIKRLLLSMLFVTMTAGLAFANGHGGPGGAGGPGGGPGDFGREGGGPLLVGSDGTVYIVRAAASSTAANPVEELVAIRSTGTTAFTVTLPSGAHGVELSGTNLLTVVNTTASGATSPTSQIVAISTATGATAWTLNIDGRVASLEPFSGGTYVVVVKPATTSGGTATRTLEAVSNSGSVLWSVAI
jgi:outer membrane protein assembly factor BamB